MKPARRALALRAHYLAKQNIAGVEAAKRLKLFVEHDAVVLAAIGANIEAVEASRLTTKERLVLKTVVRMEARRIEAGLGWIKQRDVDRVSGQRSGWSNQPLGRLCLHFQLIDYPEVHRVRLTRAGWAFAWATGLIKPSWKVPT